MFYGWKLATIGSCGNLLLQGSVFYTMNAFIEPLVELHGWSRTLLGAGSVRRSVCGRPEQIDLHFGILDEESVL